MFVSPDTLSCWKASWVCFYSCIVCYRKKGGNLICPEGWKAFHRINGSTKKVAGICQEGTMQEMFWTEVSSDSPIFLSDRPWDSCLFHQPSENLSHRTQLENIATFSLLAILSINAMQEVFGKSFKSKCCRVIGTLILYNNSSSLIKAFAEKEEM